MSARGGSAVLAMILVFTDVAPWSSPVLATSTEEIRHKVKQWQEQVNELKTQLEQSKPQASPPPPAVQPVTPVTTVPPAPPLLARPSWLSDFKLGGYGSTRFEANDLNKFSD